MIVVGASLFALVALQPPPTRAGGTQMGRRVALASGAALLAPSKRAAADLGLSPDWGPNPRYRRAEP